MKNALAALKWPVIIGTILALPFPILELVNRRGYHEEFPFGLFGLLWLLPIAFILVLMSAARDVRAGSRTVMNRIGLLLRAVFLILIAWLWISTVLDQMPCFLGVPNCD